MSSKPAPDFEVIVDNAALTAWCDNAAGASFVAVDTEFERQRTYFAELCLIQVAAGGSLACVDTLADLDLQILFQYFADDARTLMIHAARQDLEVLHFAGATRLAPLSDTQLAAALAGYAEQIGYADLVRQLLGVDLDKSQTRTNWRQRPLTSRQLHYAADDVRYLGAVHDALLGELDAAGRLAWFREDCRGLHDPESIDPPVELAWQRLKRIDGMPEAAFARAIALATWREREARARNLPRSWVLADPALHALAIQAPRDREALAVVLDGNAAFVRRDGEALLATLAAADRSDAAAPAREPPLGIEQRQCVKRINANTRDIAAQLGINPSALLTRREMEQMVRGQVPPRLVQGWRSEVLGGLVKEFCSPGDQQPAARS